VKETWTFKEPTNRSHPIVLFPRIAVRCRLWPCDAVCCIVLQYCVVCCRVLQGVAVRVGGWISFTNQTLHNLDLVPGSFLFFLSWLWFLTVIGQSGIENSFTNELLWLGSSRFLCSVLNWVALCCSALQCVAVCCSVLQCFAVCCNVLQFEAMRFNMTQKQSNEELDNPRFSGFNSAWDSK